MRHKNVITSFTTNRLTKYKAIQVFSYIRQQSEMNTRLSEQVGAPQSCFLHNLMSHKISIKEQL